jgi:hypothetical protein
MNHPVPDNEENRTEAWCKQNGVEMSFYERQGETHLMHLVRLSKDDMWVEREYTPSGNMRQAMINLAIRDMEHMIRAKARGNSGA